MPAHKHSPVAAALALLEQHQEHTLKVKATQARNDFFPLLETVVADPNEVVEVEYTGRPGRVLLVNAEYRDHMRALEQTVRALLGSAVSESSFQLAGSLAVVGEVESAVAELRDRERQAANARLADL